MPSVASVWTRWADHAVGVPGAAALGVLLAALAWQRAGWTPGLELESLPGWAALVPMRAPLESQAPPVHEAIFAVVADPTEALMAFPGDMRCGDAEMGAYVANSGRYGVAGPPDNADPHLARPVPGQGFPTAHGLTIHGIGVPQSQAGSAGPTAPWGRDTALGTDATSAQGRMWGAGLNEEVGEGGLGLAGLAGGVVKRFDVAPSAVNGTAGLRVVHTGLRVTGARKASEVGRAMAAHFGDFRACAEGVKDTRGVGTAEQSVSLAFDVSEDGRVAASSANAGSLLQCLEKVVVGVAFAPGASGDAHVVYPLYFAAADAQLTSAHVTPTRPAKACDCGG
jgi:hypothetical protein